MLLVVMLCLAHKLSDRLHSGRAPSPPSLPTPAAPRIAPAPGPSTADCAACANRLSSLPSCPPTSLMDTIIGALTLPFKVPRLDAYRVLEARWGWL